MLFDENLTAGQVIEADRAEINRQIAAAESEFRKAMAGRVKSLEWRSAITYGPLASCIADEARAADLIITGPDLGLSLTDNTRRVRIGDLVLEAGRPVLVVPRRLSILTLNNVFVGWKDVRESRRALADALPLLKLSQHVVVMETARAEQSEQARAHARVGDVAVWLERHAITAEPLVTAVAGTEIADFHAELIERGCDLLVAGAYGHSRLGEFIFGGVTRDLLLDPAYCVLISH